MIDAFLMMINDLLAWNFSCILNLYVEDTVLFLSGPSTPELAHHINDNLQTLHQWTAHTKLTINPHKTKANYYYITFFMKTFVIYIQLHITNVTLSVLSTRCNLQQILNSVTSWLIFSLATLSWVNNQAAYWPAALLPDWFSILKNRPIEFSHVSFKLHINKL